MIKSSCAVLLAGASICLLAVSDARAQAVGAGGVGVGGAEMSTPGKPTGDKWRWSLGAGAAVVPDYEGSDDYRGALFPLFRAQKGPIFAQLGPGRGGLELQSNLIPSPNWRLGPLAQLVPGQRDVEDKRVDKIRSGGTTAFNLGVSVATISVFPATRSWEFRFSHPSTSPASTTAFRSFRKWRTARRSARAGRCGLPRPAPTRPAAT